MLRDQLIEKTNISRVRENCSRVDSYLLESLSSPAM